MDTVDKILTTALRDSIHAAVLEKLKGYNSPLDAALKRTFDKHAGEIDALFDELVRTALLAPDFKSELQQAFAHKLAKTLIHNFEGEIERRATKLREDPVFRAKLIVAIENAVKPS